MSRVFLILVFAFFFFLCGTGFCNDIGAFFWEGMSLHVNGDQVTPSDSFLYLQGYQMDLHFNTSLFLEGPMIEFTSDQLFTDINPPAGYHPQADSYIWSYPDKIFTNSGTFTIAAYSEPVIQSPFYTIIRSVDSAVLADPVSEQTVTVDLTFHQPLSPDINNLCAEVRRDVDWEIFSNVVMLSETHPSGWMYNPESGQWRADNPQDIQVDTPYQFEMVLRYTKQPDHFSDNVFCKPSVSAWWGNWQSLSDSTGNSIFIVHPKGPTAYFQFDNVADWESGHGQDEQHIHIREIAEVVDDTGPSIESIICHYAQKSAGTYIAGFQAMGHNLVSGLITTPTGQSWPMEIDEGEAYLDFDFDVGLTEDQLNALGVTEGLYQLEVEDYRGESLITSFDFYPVSVSQTPVILYPPDGSSNRPRNFDVQWEPVTDSQVSEIILVAQDDFDDWDYENFTISWDAAFYPLVDLPDDMGISCELYFAHTTTGTTPSGIPVTVLSGNGRMVHFLTSSSAYFGDIDEDGDVDMADFSLFGATWMKNDCADRPAGDFDDDCDVDEVDFNIFLSNWLKD